MKLLKEWSFIELSEIKNIFSHLFYLWVSSTRYLIIVYNHNILKNIESII